MGDLARGYGSAVYDLEGARCFEGEQCEFVAARECFIDECEPGSTGINQCVGLNGNFIVYNFTRSNKMITIQFILRRRYREARDRERRQRKNIKWSRAGAVDRARD